MCKTWNGKLLVSLVIGCLISNHFRKVIQCKHTGKEKCKEKTTEYEDCRDSDGFRDVLHWHRGGLFAARWIKGRKNQWMKTQISYNSSRGNTSTFQVRISDGFEEWKIIMADDIHLNPGPIMLPCTVCKRAVASTHRALKCAGCNGFCHIVPKCGNVAVAL